MTHEELLAKIGNFTCCSGIHELALRAIVELHKPDQDYPEFCGVCWWEEHERETYPCQTIQTIEKEMVAG